MLLRPLMFIGNDMKDAILCDLCGSQQVDSKTLSSEEGMRFEKVEMDDLRSLQDGNKKVRPVDGKQLEG